MRLARLAVDPMRLALAAEFASPRALLSAAGAARAAGWRRLDAYTPFPVPGLEEELAIPRTRLRWAVLAAALAGGALGYWVQWWTAAVDYPLVVGGRPLHSAPAFVLITFESAVLCAAVTAFVGLWWAGRLPEPWSPLTEIEGFERASVDRYWLAVDERDPRLRGGPAERSAAERGLRELLAGAGALRVVRPPRAGGGGSGEGEAG